MNDKPHGASRIPLPNGAVDLSLASSGLEDHPLVKRRYFYPLPLQLKRNVIEVLGAGSFTDEELDVETATSVIVGDCSSNVGFLDGIPIPYQGFAKSDPLNFDYQTAKAVGLAQGTKAQFDLELKHLSEWLQWNETSQQAYRGWLLTNPSFLKEHDALLDKWMPFVAQVGFQKFGVGLLPAPEESNALPAEFLLKLHECSQDFHSFLHRWRLQSLAAPYLPVVAAVSLNGGGPFPERFLPATGSVYLTIPDIMPIPPANMLRPALERARYPSTDSPHLAQWHKLVSNHTNHEKQFQRYIRQFALQHFWRAFMSRHEEKSHGNLGKLQNVIADFLGIDATSLNRWMVALRKELGDQWYRRGQQFLSIE
jgi:hypothetical protein